MKKNQRIAFWVLGIFLVALFVGNMDLFSITDMTIASVSLINGISNDADLSTSFFRIITYPATGNDILVAVVDKNEFNDDLTDYKTTFDLEIFVNLDKQTAIYPIKLGDGDDLFYTYDLIIKQDPLIGSADPCPIGTIHDFNRLGEDRFCITKTYAGRFGDPIEPIIDIDAEITLESGGDVQSKLLSNFGEDTQIEFEKDNKVVARAKLLSVGDSVGANPPDEDDYRSLYLEGSGEWRLVLATDYVQYLTQANDLENAVGLNSDINSNCGWDWSGACLEGRMRDYLNNGVKEEESDLISKPVSFGDGIFNIQQEGEWNSEFMYQTYDTKLTNTVIQIDVLAEWIGVKNLVAEPVIQSINCDDFEQNGYIDLVVKNNGPVDSNFDVTLNCGQILMTGDVLQKTILSQDIATFIIPISPINLADLTETCTVKVYNVGKSTLFDEKTVSCTAKEISACTPGYQKVETNAVGKTCVYECNSQGSYPTLAKFCCDSGVKVYFEGNLKKFECENKSVDDLIECADCNAYAKDLIFGSFIESQRCEKRFIQNSFTCLFAIIKLAFVPISFILALIFGLAGMSKIKALNKNKGLLWVLNITLASLIAYLSFILFYVGLALFGFIAIISVFIPRIR